MRPTSTIANVAMFVFVLATALGFTHWAMMYDAVAWWPALTLYLLTFLTAILTIYQEVVNMTLPRIRRLDLRRGNELDRFFAGRRGRDRASVLEPFPDNWYASP